jgi:hypothetical protein
VRQTKVWRVRRSKPPSPQTAHNPCYVKFKTEGTGKKPSVSTPLWGFDPIGSECPLEPADLRQAMSDRMYAVAKFNGRFWRVVVFGSRSWERAAWRFVVSRRKEAAIATARRLNDRLPPLAARRP